MSSLYTLPSSLRIGVVRGGRSPRYDDSLQNGAQVLNHFGVTHRPVDVFISKDGTWHMHGMEKSPDKILKHVDVAINTISGELPGHHRVIEVLNSHAIPYVGSSPFASAISHNTHIAKEHARLLGLRTPTSFIVRRSDSLFDKAQEVFKSIPNPLVVKPVSDTSTLHFYVVQSFTDLLSALENILYAHPSALVEEYIAGKEVSTIVTDNFRNKNVYSFPPLAVLSKVEEDEVEYVAKKIHEALGLSHYSQTNFVVSPRRGVYFLEIQTVPDFKEKSKLLESLESVGVSAKEFLHHLVGLALNKK